MERSFLIQKSVPLASHNVRGGISGNVSKFKRKIHDSSKGEEHRELSQKGRDLDLDGKEGRDTPAEQIKRIGKVRDHEYQVCEITVRLRGN